MEVKMGEGIIYWVMQTLQGGTYAHGFYVSKKAAENRRDKIHGGEAVLYKTFTRDPEQAVQEFLLEDL